MVVELGIVSFITGSFSFIITLRNAVSRVLEDVDQVRNDFGFLLDAGLRLTLVAQTLRIWQTRWHVDPYCSEELFVRFWGSEGQRLVMSWATYIDTSVRAAWSEYKSHYSGPFERLEMSNGMDDRLEDSLYQWLQSQQRQWKSEQSKLRRTVRATFELPLFETHLKKIEASVANLQQFSKVMYINHKKDGLEDGWEEHLSETTFGFHLMKLSESNVIGSPMIREMILESQDDCTIELHLDHRVDPTDRIRTIKTAWGARALGHHFCLTSGEFTGSAHVDFSCTLANRHADANRSYKMREFDFETVALHLHAYKPSKKFYRSTDRQEFVVSTDIATCDVDGMHISCLRTFTLEQDAGPFEHLHGEFKREERQRLAYELAEWTLLCLRTLWFADLCSCCIIRAQTPDLYTKFKKIVTPISHIDTETGNHESNTQWCQQELTGMHIRRLGVLLAEIACFQPIFELDLHPQHGIRFFQATADHEINDDIMLRTAELNRMVKQGMGERYLEVVLYCLAQDKTADTITARDVRKFYEYVVKPLYKSYHGITVDDNGVRASRRERLRQRPQRIAQLSLQSQ